MREETDQNVDVNVEEENIKIEKMEATVVNENDKISSNLNGDDDHSNLKDNEDIKDEKYEKYEKDEEDIGMEMEDLEEPRQNEIREEMKIVGAEFSHLKDTFYGEKIHEVENRYESIKNESNEEFLELLKDSKKILDEKIWASNKWKEFQIQAIEAVYEQETREAHAEYQEFKENVKEKALAKAREEMTDLSRKKEILSLHEGGNTGIDGESFDKGIDPSSRTTTPSSSSVSSKVERSRGGGGPLGRKRGGSASYTDAHSRKKMFPACVYYSLKESDVNEDLYLIQEQLSSEKNTGSIKVSVESGNLRYNGKLFEKGQDVVVEKVSTHEKFVGYISVITSMAVTIRNPTLGEKYRFVISTLKSGKFIIH